MKNSITERSVSVIVPVCERHQHIIDSYREYRDYLSPRIQQIEYIYIINEDQPTVAAQLEEVAETDKELKIVVLSRNYGEATAIKAGLSVASGDLVLTLEPYKQVNTEELHKLFDQIPHCDLVLAKRWPRVDSKTNRLQTGLFGKLVQQLSGHNYSDIGCGVRLAKREVFERTSMYGDQNRFLPMLAYQQGYRSQEVCLGQATEDGSTRMYKPGVYLRRALDLLTIVFLTKFYRKPLRFFGLIAAGLITIGAIGLLYLGYERLLFDVAISNRPLLVIFALLFLLGIQLLAIGLIGETVIFTHARDNKEYKIKSIIRGKTVEAVRSPSDIAAN